MGIPEHHHERELPAARIRRTVDGTIYVAIVANGPALGNPTDPTVTPQFRLATSIENADLSKKS